MINEIILIAMITRVFIIHLSFSSAVILFARIPSFSAAVCLSHFLCIIWSLVI